MLSFSKEKMAKYLKFDEDTHTVQIIGDPPAEILQYSDGSNKFDVKKVYENFLRCVYEAVNEMSKHPSEYKTLNLYQWTGNLAPLKEKDRFAICL